MTLVEKPWIAEKTDVRRQCIFDCAERDCQACTLNCATDYCYCNEHCMCFCEEECYLNCENYCKEQQSSNETSAEITTITDSAEINNINDDDDKSDDYDDNGDDYNEDGDGDVNGNEYDEDDDGDGDIYDDSDGNDNGDGNDDGDCDYEKDCDCDRNSPYISRRHSFLAAKAAQ